MISRFALTQFEEDCLERMVDGSNLVTVLEALADISRRKAEHIRDWLLNPVTGLPREQDKAIAKPWDDAAKRIERAMIDMEV
jgi:hypothetical protein